MNYNVLFSVIIPQRNSVSTLSRLFASIPDRDDIEIIVVDNTPIPITKEEVGIDREYQLLWSAPERHAGGARNVGIENAHGKWLLFADADDYYADGAFDVFFSKVDSDAEIIYTGMGGIYLDTGERSDRGDVYAKLVHEYVEGKRTEEDLRFGFASPCCKMISHDLVDRYNLKYDEIRAGNDAYFSLASGCYAKKIDAVDVISYIATVSRGTLTRRRDYEVTKARLYSKLHCNQFLKAHGYPNMQRSVMNHLYESRRLGIKVFFEFCGMIMRFRQNPFIGWNRWFLSFRRNRKKEQKEAKYIVN